MSDLRKDCTKVSAPTIPRSHIVAYEESEYYAEDGLPSDFIEQSRNLLRQLNIEPMHHQWMMPEDATSMMLEDLWNAVTDGESRLSEITTKLGVQNYVLNAAFERAGLHIMIDNPDNNNIWSSW